jgi:hypothetical protein
MTQQNNAFNVFDPTGLLKNMRDSSMDAWSKMMIQLVNSDAYGEATGKLLDSWLSASAPFREVLETIVTRVLTNLNLPTRADVTGLAERLTNIEFRLDDLEAKLEETQRPSRKAPGAKNRPSSGEDKP